MSSKNLLELAREINLTAHEKGWWDRERSFAEVIALIHSEASEALEEWREGFELTHIYYSENDKPEGVPIELADIIIRVLDVCWEHSIAIDYAMQVKMKYNQTRPYRHGGKKA